MTDRAYNRANIILRALWHQMTTMGRRRKPNAPRRILVAHHLLLGDTLMLTPLLAKLRQQYPVAEIVMTVPAAIAPLYEKKPYGVVAWAFDLRRAAALSTILRQGNFDLAVVPGDNRHAWLAAALNARWIVCHSGDHPGYKNWPADEQFPYPKAPAAWGDMVAELIEGPPPLAYRTKDWLAPNAQAFDLPPSPYAILHVGASTPLKQWPAANWRILADELCRRGFTVVWSGGAGETTIVEEIDPRGAHSSFVGMLDLAQLWRLIAGAAVFVSPDTGVAHLGRIVGTPTVALFGPGSAVLCGAGAFWRESPYRAVTIAEFPCRDQRILFRREISWVRRCGRSTRECASARCMQAIDVAAVDAAIADVVKDPGMITAKTG
jgi:ADP-heptose:LPS heptosyltransferase